MNDLVRALRDRAAQLKSERLGGAESVFNYDAVLFEKAADEIERLRGEILHYEHQCELGSQEIERLQNQVKGMRFIIEGPRGEDLANMTGDE